jgi:hypothetical protein
MLFPNPRIAICIASSGLCRAKFAFSLANLTAFLAAKPLHSEIDSQHFLTLLSESSNLAQNQAILYNSAKKWNATHLLFLEDDMTFPRTALHTLFSRNKPWVGANYRRRTPPYDFIATRPDLSRISTTNLSSGLEPALFTGFGVALFETPSLERLPQPLFEAPFHSETDYLSTDARLGQLFAAESLPCFVDHDLSKDVRHLGEFPIGPDFSLA